MNESDAGITSALKILPSHQSKGARAAISINLKRIVAKWPHLKRYPSQKVDQLYTKIWYTNAMS